jgi:hypothetical protein
MPSTIAEVDRLFAAGAESVALTRAEWEAIQAVSQGYAANGLEVRRAQRESDRVKRISRPVWRASAIVAAEMRRALEGSYRASQHVALQRVREWEMRLRHSMDVDWAKNGKGHSREWPKPLLLLVGGSGFEPLTPAV